MKIPFMSILLPTLSQMTQPKWSSGFLVVSQQFLHFVLPCLCLSFMLGMSLMGILNACIEEEYISWNESLLKKKWGSIS